MADYASNGPVSGPRRMEWKAAWDFGGMAWSHEWGMFYNVTDTGAFLPLRDPSPPRGR